MKKGFTLIEAMVVIAIIGIVIAIFLSAGVKSGKVTVIDTPTAQAEGVLPDSVTKFSDGSVTCYVYSKYEVWHNTDTVGGISCVNTN